MAGPQDIVNSRIAELESYIGKTNAELMGQIQGILSPEGIGTQGLKSSADSTYYKNIQNSNNSITSKTAANKEIRQSYATDLSQLQKQFDDGAITKQQLDAQRAQIDQIYQSNLAVIDQMIESKNGAAATRGEAIQEFKSRIELTMQDYAKQMGTKSAKLADAKKLEDTQNKMLAEAYDMMRGADKKVASLQSKIFEQATNEETRDRINYEMNEKKYNEMFADEKFANNRVALNKKLKKTNPVRKNKQLPKGTFINKNLAKRQNDITKLAALMNEYATMSGEKLRYVSEAMLDPSTPASKWLNQQGYTGQVSRDIVKKADELAFTGEKRYQRAPKTVFGSLPKISKTSSSPQPEPSKGLRISGSTPKRLTDAITPPPPSHPRIDPAPPSNPIDKRMVDNFAAIGRGIDVRPLMGSTVGQYKQQAIEAFKKQGVGLAFEGDNAIFSYKDNEPISIPLASLSAGYTVTRGGQKYANRAFADTEWSPDGKSKNILIDSYGMQFKDLANMATKYVYDEEGEVIDTIDGMLTQAIKEQDANAAKAMGNNLVKRSINNAPDNMSKSVEKEVNEQGMAAKTDENAYVQRGTFSMNKLYENFIRNKHNVDFFQAYNDATNGQSYNLKDRSIPLPSSMLSDLGKLYDLKSRGDTITEEELTKMQDSHLAKILYNGKYNDNGKYEVTIPEQKDENGVITQEAQTYETNLGYLLKAMDEYIGAGLVPVMDSMKEENVLAGYRTVASANDLMPFGFVKNSSSRAQNQAKNYIERADRSIVDRFVGERGEEIESSTPLFSSRAHRKNDISTTNAESQLYTGGMANDVDIWKAIKEIQAEQPGLISDELAQTMSTYEGGMIIGSDFAKELTGYLDKQATEYDEDIDLAGLEKLGIHMSDLHSLKEGETLSLDHLVDEDGLSFSNKVKLKGGDRVRGIERTAEGMKLRYQALTTAETGGKGLIEAGGGRQSLRVVPQEIMNALTKKLGIEGAQYITEHTHDETKKGQFDLTGRYQEIIANAQKQGLTNEEILSGFKGTQYEKAMRMNEQGQIESTVFMDEASGRVMYEDINTGQIQNFWDYDEEGNAPMEKVASAIIEDLGGLVGKIDGITEDTRSDMQKFEDNLGAMIGEGFERSNPKLFKDAVNLANKHPYEVPVGSGNPDTIEAQERVKMSTKGRIANENVIAMTKIKHRGDVEALEQIDAFLQAEQKSTDRIGKKRQKAIDDKAAITKALDASFDHNDYGYRGKAKFSFSGKEKEGLYGEDRTLRVGLNEAGQITFNDQPVSGVITNLEYDESGKTGYKSTDYRKSLVGQIKQYMADNFADKDGNIHGQVMVQGQDGQSMLMPLTSDKQLHNGNMLISRTSGALHGMFKQEADGTFSMASDAFDTVRNNLADYVTNKDSELVKTADEAYLPNSTWGITVGANVADEQNNIDNANTVYMTEKQIRSMLTTEKTATEADIMKNAEQLIKMYYSQAEGTFEERKAAVDKEIAELQRVKGSKRIKDKNKAKYYRKMEKKYTDKIMSGVKDGTHDLYGQFTRQPYTSGQDIRYSTIKVNNALADKSMMIHRAQADTAKADFDGDETTARVTGLDFADDFETYEKQAKGNAKVVQYHKEVAQDIDPQLGAPEVGGHDADKQYKYIQDMANRRSDQIAGFMSKYNKEFVGKDSNVSTAMRNFMRAFDADEVAKAKDDNAVSDKELAYALVSRALTEGFEQEPISAKKVFKRIIGGGKYEMDELAPIYKNMRSGNFDAVIDAGIEKNILARDDEGNFDGKQWRLAKSTAKAAGIDFDEIFAGQSDEEIMKGALKHIVNLAEENKLKMRTVTGMKSTRKIQSAGAHAAYMKKRQAKMRGDMSSGSGVLEKTIQNATAVAEQAKVTADEAKAEADSAKTEANIAKEEADQAMIDEEGGGPRTTGKYRAMKATNAADYETSHVRELREWDGSGSTLKSGGGYGATASQIDDIAGYAKNKSNSQFWGKPEQVNPAVQASSALGTYGHKVAEILNKHQAKFLKDLDGVLTEEEKKELAYAEKVALGQYGLVSEQDLIEYAQGAEQLVNAGRQAAPELFGANAITEHAMGGVFVRDDGTEHTFSGEADVMARKDDGSGYSIGDYKFSKKSGGDTIAKRIMQQSIYLAMREQELVEQIKAIDNGADLGLDKASLEADLNAIRKGNETGNNTINIFRRNKEGLIEVVKAQALKTDEVLKVADMSAEYVELQNIIEAESAKFKGYDNLMRSNATEAIQKVEKAQQRQAEIRNSGIMKSAIDRLKQSGITKNEKGELIDDNGLIGMLYGGYQTATGEFTQQQSGLETRGKKAPSNMDAVNRYLKSARRASSLEQDIARRQVLANQSTGSEQRNHQEVIRTAQGQLAVEQSKLALYNRQEGTLNGIKLSEKEIAKLETESAYIQQKKEMALVKIGANMKMEQGLLDKMLNGFKQQFSNFLGMNMTYQLVGKIRQLFSEIVQLTAQLDANMGATCC